MPSAIEKKHVNSLIFIFFVASLVIGVIPWAVFGDANTAQSGMASKIIWQISNLAYMVGCCLFSLKAGAEDKIIAPAGFIVLSIGVGTLFALQTSSFGEEANKAYASGILAYIPGMVLICYYDRFPVWLRIGGLLACIPRIIILILILNDSFDWTKHNMIDGAGYMLTSIVGIGWAYFAMRPLKKFRTN